MEANCYLANKARAMTQQAHPTSLAVALHWFTKNGIAYLLMYDDTARIEATRGILPICVEGSILGQPTEEFEPCRWPKMRAMISLSELLMPW